MSKLSSFLKKRGGKVGQALNAVGKVLPSGGQLIGGAALGPLGQVVGGRVDPNTSGTQRKIGDVVAGTAGAIGLGSLAGLPLGKVAGSLPLGGIAGKIAGGIGGLGLGDLIDLGLGGANMYGAAKLGQQSTDYAKKAEDAVTGSYTERAPLRAAGVQGMLNPGAGVPLALSGVNAVQGPQIAPQPAPIPLNDPRLAMVNRTLGRGNPFADAPLAIPGAR
jgi:hypothetical protein